MNDAINFEALASALLSRSETLVPDWLPGGHRRGHEWACGSLHGGAGDSCSVNLTNGRWADFATDEKGNDLVALYKAVYGHATMAAAAVALAHDYGLEEVGNIKAPRPGAAPAPRALPPAAPPKPQAHGEWEPICPAPSSAPEFKFTHWHYKPEDIEHTACYRLNSDVYGYVVRVRRSGGGKEPLPFVWAKSAKNGMLGWINKSMTEPRALYLPGGMLPTAQQTAIVVEGEKKADALQALMDAFATGVYVVVSWPGGCKAWKKAAWNWLHGSTLLLWPDCDAKREPLPRSELAALAEAERDARMAAQPFLPEAKQPGMAAMLGIGAALRDEHGCTVSLLPIPAPGAVADGWDCADAIADGWDGQRMLELFGRAQPLPVVAVDSGADGEAGGKVLPLNAAGGDGPAAAGGGSAGSGGSGGGDDGGKEPPYGTPDWLKPYWHKQQKRWLLGRKMVIKALTEDMSLRDVLAYDMLRNQAVARMDWPWLHGKAGPVESATPLMLGMWLSDTYGLPAISVTALVEAMDSVAYARRYHPIVEWLKSINHDGKPRIEKWLLHALGYEPGALPAKTERYLARVGRYWLIAMVKRVMEPGCKFDYMPVLEGKGGVGKSSMARALAGDDLFSDTAFQIGQGKDGFEQLRGVWLYELAELSHLNRAEANAVKGFVSSQVDRYRGAYGRAVDAYPRQCVFVGTTNERQYLQDRTGNRRFWPIPCDNVIRVDWVAKYREQLFAEAYALWLAGEACWPTREEEAELFAPMQDARLKETPVASALFWMLTRPGILKDTTGGGTNANSISEFTTFVRIDELCMALGADAGKASVQLANEVRAWLDAQGWPRKKKMIAGHRHWGYERPAAWPEDDAEGSDEPTAGREPGADGDDDDVPF